MNETPAMILSKAHKQSVKDRWTDHFTLQLRSAGFKVLPIGAPADVGDYQNPMVVFQEFRFHDTRKWRFDYAIPLFKIAIEVEGGIFMRGGGAHSRPMNIMRDVEKGNAATMLGWRLLRFTPNEIKSGESIRMTTELVGQVR